MRKNSLLPLLFVFCLLNSSAWAGRLAAVGPAPENQANLSTPDKIALGKQLFFDRRLSGDGTMSCASCHLPELAFTDGEAVSLSYPTTRNWRNAPTLINVGHYRRLFHDGRAASLEEQALFPMLSAFEMNQNLDFLEEEIRSVPEYAAAFQKVFGSPDTSRERIAMAIAVFERSLISKNAPLDRFLAGDERALSEKARKGYEIFMGKGHCADCHDGAILSDERFHALRTPEHPDFQNDPRVAATRRFVAKITGFAEFRTIAEDPGRFLISKDKKDWLAFRTPTLREIAKTGPYMHNGIFATLDAVIEFFNQGGGTGNTSLTPLGLAAAEKEALKTFMTEALTGDDLAMKPPVIP